jgi:hypothetical protein
MSNLFPLMTIILIISLPQFLMPQTKNIPPDDSSNSSGSGNIISKLEKMIFVKDEQGSGNIMLASDKILIRKYAGKIIRKINIRILDVFGSSIFNPQDTVRSWLVDKGNSLHAKTKEWLIKDKLIFYEGQKLIPFNILESERIIRQTPYVYDVRIIPQKISNNSDSVDIIVYTKDIWSTNGSLKYRPGGKSGGFTFNDINFLGYGNSFIGGFKIDPKYSHGWDWDGDYTVDNIGKMFLSGTVYYFSDLYRQRFGIVIGRDFFSPVITWAGAISQNWQITRFPIVKDSILHFEFASFNRQDYWFGYAFDLKPFDPNTVYQNRFNVSGRIIRTVFSRKPDFDTVNSFQDNTFYLGRIGFSYKRFYQDRFILGLGKTEDIPLINIIEFLFGYEKGASNNMPYYGLKTGYSFYADRLGYLYSGFQIGAFRNNNKWSNENSILELLYFSKILPFGTYNWRHYLGFRFSSNSDPLGAEILSINKTDGVRGFSDNLLKGNKKLVLNYEADIFAPFKFLNFNLAFITFADFALISPYNVSFFESKLYQGYGVGFRIKNEQLIFPQFQLLFGFYPNAQQNGSQFNIFSQGSIFNRFNPFQSSIPSIVSAD